MKFETQQQGEGDGFDGGVFHEDGFVGGVAAGDNAADVHARYSRTSKDASDCTFLEEVREVWGERITQSTLRARSSLRRQEMSWLGRQRYVEEFGEARREGIR